MFGSLKIAVQPRKGPWRNVKAPPAVQPLRSISPNVNIHPHSPSSPIQTPIDALSLKTLRCKAGAHVKTADDDTRLSLEKFADTAEKSMAACALIDSQMRLLEKQNNEKKVREAARPTIFGKRTILSWADVVAAQKRQDQKVISKTRPAEHKMKRRAAVLHPCRRERSQADEKVEAEREIAASGLTSFCTVF